MSQLPAPSEAALAHSLQLVTHIRQQIDATGGWIDFARFMDLALYTPGLGYYSAGATKFGSAGDFITAPELTPLFGQTLAQQLAEVLPIPQATFSNSARVAANWPSTSCRSWNA
jgi:SAM-dependent MidA family methyltransferase